MAQRFFIFSYFFIFFIYFGSCGRQAGLTASLRVHINIASVLTYLLLHPLVVCFCPAATIRPVRRQEYPADSAPGARMTWQWEGDVVGSWYPYSAEVASLLEKAHRCGASAVDLSRHPYNIPYVVRLSDMMQV